MSSKEKPELVKGAKFSAKIALASLDNLTKLGKHKSNQGRKAPLRHYASSNRMEAKAMIETAKYIFTHYIIGLIGAIVIFKIIVRQFGHRN